MLWETRGVLEREMRILALESRLREARGEAERFGTGERRGIEAVALG